MPENAREVVERCFATLCEWDAMSGAAGEFVKEEITKTLTAYVGRCV